LSFPTTATRIASVPFLALVTEVVTIGLALTVRSSGFECFTGKGRISDSGYPKPVLGEDGQFDSKLPRLRFGLFEFAADG
jgi:hypothetical protein